MSSHGDPVISSNMGGAYAYRASKAALNIINKSLQFDLKDQGVQCLLVHPGARLMALKAFRPVLLISPFTKRSLI